MGASGLTSTLKPFTYQAKAVDSDGDKLSYRLLEAPQGAKIDAATGLLTWAEPQAGSFTFRIEADDGKGGTVVQSFTTVFRAGGSGSACITVQSRQSLELDDCDAKRHIVVAGNAGATSVDWNGGASHGFGQTRIREDDWVADLVCGKEKSLAERTGLRVKI